MSLKLATDGSLGPETPVKSHKPKGWYSPGKTPKAIVPPRKSSIFEDDPGTPSSFGRRSDISSLGDRLNNSGYGEDLDEPELRAHVRSNFPAEFSRNMWKWETDLQRVLVSTIRFVSSPKSLHKLTRSADNQIGGTVVGECEDDDDEVMAENIYHRMSSSPPDCLLFWSDANAYEGCQISQLTILDNFRPQGEDELLKALERAGVPVQSWSEYPLAKAPADLMRELKDNKASLWTGQGSVFRVVQVINVTIQREEWRGDPEVEEHVLIELYEADVETGASRRRVAPPCSKLPALPIKRELARETIEREVCQCVFRQLCVPVRAPDRVVSEGPSRCLWRPSTSFPGLPTCFVVHPVRVVLVGLPPGTFMSGGEKTRQVHYWQWYPRSLGDRLTEPRTLKKSSQPPLQPRRKSTYDTIDSSDSDDDDTGAVTRKASLGKRQSEFFTMSDLNGLVSKDTVMSQEGAETAKVELLDLLKHFKHVQIRRLGRHPAPPLHGSMSRIRPTLYHVDGFDEYAVQQYPSVAKLHTLPELKIECERHAVAVKNFGLECIPQIVRVSSPPEGIQGEAARAAVLYEMNAGRWFVPELRNRCRVTVLRDIYDEVCSTLVSGEIAYKLRSENGFMSLHAATDLLVGTILLPRHRTVISRKWNIAATGGVVPPAETKQTTKLVSLSQHIMLLINTSGVALKGHKLKPMNDAIMYLTKDKGGREKADELKKFAEWVSGDGRRFFKRTYDISVQHGNMAMGNVVVDNQDKLWLMDYSESMREGLFLNDIVRLELSVLIDCAVGAIVHDPDSPVAVERQQSLTVSKLAPKPDKYLMVDPETQAIIQLVKLLYSPNEDGPWALSDDILDSIRKSRTRKEGIAGRLVLQIRKWLESYAAASSDHVSLMIQFYVISLKFSLAHLSFQPMEEGLNVMEHKMIAVTIAERSAACLRYLSDLLSRQANPTATPKSEMEEVVDEKPEPDGNTVEPVEVNVDNDVTDEDGESQAPPNTNSKVLNKMDDLRAMRSANEAARYNKQRGEEKKLDAFIEMILRDNCSVIDPIDLERLDLVAQPTSIRVIDAATVEGMIANGSQSGGHSEGNSMNTLLHKSMHPKCIVCSGKRGVGTWICGCPDYMKASCTQQVLCDHCKEATSEDLPVDKQHILEPFRPSKHPEVPGIHWILKDQITTGVSTKPVWSRKKRHLLLVGLPSCGKSTILRQVCMGTALASHRIRLNKKKKHQFYEVNVTPILVSLADVIRFAEANEGTIDKDADLFQSFWDFSLGLHTPHRAHLAAACENHGMLVILIDGLEDVPDKWVERTVLSMEALAAQSHRLIVTTRPWNWEFVRTHFLLSEKATIEREKKLQRRVDHLKNVAVSWDWDFCAIPDLGEEIQRNMCQTRMFGQSKQFMDDIMSKGLCSNFARTPLLLSTLIYIYRKRASIPEEQSELLEAAIRTQMESLKNTNADVFTDGSAPDQDAIYRFVKKLAYYVHFEMPEGAREFEAGVGAKVDGYGVHGDHWEFIRPVMDEDKLALFARFGHESYRFVQPEFQEYLAACQITGEIHKALATYDDVMLDLESHLGSDWGQHLDDGPLLYLNKMAASVDNTLVFLLGGNELEKMASQWFENVLRLCARLVSGRAMVCIHLALQYRANATARHSPTAEDKDSPLGVHMPLSVANVIRWFVEVRGVLDLQGHMEKVKSIQTHKADGTEAPPMPYISFPGLFFTGCLTNDNLEMLSNTLKLNRTIKFLNFMGNGIGPKGASKLAHALKINRCITSVDLSWNAIRDQGLKDINDVLKANKALVALDLTSNMLTNNGIELVKKSAQPHVELRLQHNNGPAPSQGAAQDNSTCASLVNSTGLAE